MDISTGRVPADPGQVDVSVIWELEYWMGVFAASEEHLREAVDAVGTGTEDVKAFLEKAHAERSQAS
ncbi:MAG: DUF3606 domain-containing protein [Pseudomonadota bacterium]